MQFTASVLSAPQTTMLKCNAPTFPVQIVKERISCD